jgi:hypothetical protein
MTKKEEKLRNCHYPHNFSALDDFFHCGTIFRKEIAMFGEKIAIF